MTRRVLISLTAAPSRALTWRPSIETAADGRNEIGVPLYAERIFGGLSGLQRRAQDARVAPDGQRIGVAVEA
jgi:hypothetical protein